MLLSLSVTDNEKAYSLTFTVHPEFLYAHLKAEKIDEGIINGYVSELVARSDESGTDKILLYRDVPAVLPEGYVFHTVNDSLAALRGKKLALVNPYRELDEAIKFGMTVGQNRGANYKMFADVESATEWLLTLNVSDRLFESG